jgi:hypothetical protein
MNAMTPSKINELLAKPTITPQQLYESGLLQSSRNTVYAACRDGTVDVMRVGKKILVKTAPLKRQLGL